ncbi:MAG: helix-turn-helix domain-containing protein [Caldilineaceae bacterium]|nr:helix-turn-helix domain-containing protein [Caldilineaceae bacterium]
MRILTTGQTAKALRTSVDTVRRLIRLGELKAEKLTAGSRHRIREDALREYAQRQRVTLSLDAIDSE